jgi:hypothetical protein
VPFRNHCQNWVCVVQNCFRSRQIISAVLFFLLSFFRCFRSRLIRILRVSKPLTLQRVRSQPPNDRLVWCAPAQNGKPSLKAKSKLAGCKQWTSQPPKVSFHNLRGWLSWANNQIWMPMNWNLGQFATKRALWLELILRCAFLAASCFLKFESSPRSALRWNCSTLHLSLRAESGVDVPVVTRQVMTGVSY